MTRARLAIVLLLVVAGFFAAGPWLGCAVVLPGPAGFPDFGNVNAVDLRVCTFGDAFMRPGYGVPGFTGPYWGSLLVGIAYLIAALSVARSKRAL